MPSNSRGFQVVPSDHLLANSSSGHRTVVFCHLACACRHAVVSRIAEAFYVDTASPVLVRTGLSRVHGHEEHGWYARAIRPLGRDKFTWTLAASLNLSAQMSTAPQLDAKGWAKTIGPEQGRTEPAASETPLDLYCNKCGVRIRRPAAELVGAAQKHPGQHEPGGKLVAYLADRGEVVYRIDAYAEQLTTRDLRAQGAARRRTAAVRAPEGRTQQKAAAAPQR
jgi:hypothetical protein